MTASYFDVDGTLTRTTLFDALRFYLRVAAPRGARARLARAAAAAPLLLATDQIATFHALLFRAYAGFDASLLEEHADAAVNEVLSSRLFDDAKRALAAARAANERIVLVSGSPSFLIERLQAQLGADASYANRLVIVDGRATGALVDPLVAGPNKARVVIDDAHAHGHALAECAAFSDSSTDLPMLAVVGRPHVVNGDLRLRALARAHGWPAHRWR